jgi:hypothetical protein
LIPLFLGFVCPFYGLLRSRWPHFILFSFFFNFQSFFGGAYGTRPPNTIFAIPAIDGDANAYTYPAMGGFKIEVAVFKKNGPLEKKETDSEQKKN